MNERLLRMLMAHRGYSEEAPADGGGGGAGAGGGEGDGGGGEFDWRGALPEELRNDATFKPYKTFADMAKDLVGTKRMLGNRIPIPGKDAPDDVRQEFRDKLANIEGVAVMPDPGDKAGMAEFMRKLGMPESADKYEFKAPESLPDGVEMSPDMEKWFKGVAHEAHLTNAQANAINGAYMQMMGEMAAQSREATSAAKAELLKLWGPAHDTRKGVAHAVVGKLYEGENADALKALMEQHPLIMHAFGELGMQMGEASLVKGEGSDGQLTAAELDEQIGQLSGSKAYTDNKHPDHKRIVDQVAKLYQKKSEFQAKLRQQQKSA